MPSPSILLRTAAPVGDPGSDAVATGPKPSNVYNDR